MQKRADEQTTPTAQRRAEAESGSGKAAAVQRLQKLAGNAAVSGALGTVQRNQIKADDEEVGN